MYKCNHCGEFFGEPSIGEMERDTGYTPSMCPFCGEPDDYEDADTCQCGEPIEMGEDFCEECQGKIEDALEEARKKIGYDEDDWYNALVWWVETNN